MNLICILSVIIILLTQHFNAQSECNRTIRRPEIRDLSRTELRTLIDAINELKRQGTFDQFSKIHFDSNPYSHGVPAFLPWHREFIYNYELELKKINNSIILPYWDWSIDSQSPERSEIFRLFGGNGSTDNCLFTGPFGNWTNDIPEPHCLRRDFDLNNKISAFYSPEAIEILIQQSDTYDEFRTSLEGLPHARVHSGIGGKHGDFMTMFSSNDPLFYFHHAFVDLLWYEWQIRNPELANTFNGDRNGTAANANDNLRHYNVPVRSTLDAKTTYCYDYPRYRIDLPNTDNSRIRPRGLLSTVLNPVINTLKVDKILNNVLNNVNNLITLDGGDRETKFKIRQVKSIDDRFLTNNNLPKDKIRLLEDRINQITSYYNSLPNFIPKARLL